MSLSQNIKKLRLEKGITQEQLANDLGISAQAVSKWETSDTYPDGTLLLPLAKALDTSLDTLFGNETYSMKDVSSRIRRLISSAPENERFHLARDICWQVEKGIFSHYMLVDEGYYPDDIVNNNRSSYVLNDYGFTYVSNGISPFFSAFPEYDDCFTKAVGDGEEMRQIFEKLASPEIMRAVLFIHHKENGYLFDAELLASECDIPSDMIGDVTEALLSLRFVREKEIELDGKMCKLYHAYPSHVFIAMLLFAKELNYDDGYRYMYHGRSKPLLK